MLKSVLIAVLLFAVVCSTWAEYDHSTDCVLCEETIKAAEKKLGPVANKTDSDIENALIDACKDFGPLKFECIRFIEEENTKIIDGIRNDVAPKQICIDINKCPASFYAKK